MVYLYDISYLTSLAITDTYKRPSPPTTKTLPFPSAIARWARRLVWRFPTSVQSSKVYFAIRELSLPSHAPPMRRIESPRLTVAYAKILNHKILETIWRLNLPRWAKGISSSGCPNAWLSIENFDLIIIFRPTASNSHNLIFNVAKGCPLMPILRVWKIHRGFTIVT